MEELARPGDLFAFIYAFLFIFVALSASLGASERLVGVWVVRGAVVL